MDNWFVENPVEVEWFGARWVPGELEENHELMTMLEHNFVEIEGNKPIIEASPWGLMEAYLHKSQVYQR